MRFPTSFLCAACLPLGVLATGAGVARAQNTLPAGYGVQAYTPRDFRLPEGAGCSGDIARWQAVQANDYASGNVNLRVYNQIQNEIARAAEACSARRASSSPLPRPATAIRNSGRYLASLDRR